MKVDWEQIQNIIEVWFVSHCVIRNGSGGTPFRVIPSQLILETMRILAKTLFDLGYPLEVLHNHEMRLRVANRLWRENRIVRMSRAEISRAKEGAIEDWSLAVNELAVMTFSKVEPLKIEESPVIPEVKEKPVEIEPANRLKVNTVGFADAIPDLEFMAELGIEPSEHTDGK